MTISMAKAKQLCNATEIALVTASTRQEIGKLPPSQLRQKVTRARKLRDKWRDQAERQRREVQTKQRARQTSASARSADKSELFQEVLERFEKQLAKVDGEKGADASTRKRSPRKVRSKQHRSERAEVRDALDQTRRQLQESKAARPKKATSKTESAPARPRQETAAAAPASAAEARNPAAASPSKKRSRGPVQTPASSTMQKLAAAQNLRHTKGKQRRATTAAKQDRFKAGGQVRIQKHVSAQNKRRQARRDSK